MADLEIRVIEGTELAEKFKASGAMAHQVMRREVGEAQLKLAAAMKRNIKALFKQHTGDFVRSISMEPIVDSGDEISGRTGSNEEYAEAHEEGYWIDAKNVRNLTIPLEAFMTASGVARGSARDVIANPEAFGYDGTFFSKGVLFGKLPLGEKREAKGATIEGVEALFALKPSIKLPQRRWARPAAQEVQPQFQEAMRAALEALL
jgi:hypothetical protein